MLLTSATFLCLLPFIGKAFNVDDPLFIWSAQQIARHPLNPYGFQLIWYWSSMPMAEVTKNPPLACYYVAAIGAIAGLSEWALHLGFLLPTLAMVLGTNRLAHHFTRSPLLAAAATLLTPGVLVSATSVLCNVMMLAFWIWAIIFWLEGLDSGKQHYLLISSFLMACAALTKYFGICLLPLLFVYSLAKQRRLGSWALYFVFPISLLAGYQFWMRALYGRGMFSDAFLFASGRVEEARYKVLLYPLVCASFIGGCALSALTLAPLVWSRRYILVAILVEAVATTAGWMVLGPRMHEHHTFMVLRQHGWIVGPQLALFIAAGVSVLALTVMDVWTHRDAESLLLALWVFGTFIFAAFLNWIINARSVLPLIPAAGVLLARRLDALGIASAKPLRWKATVAVLISGMVSLWIAQADADWANSARRVAENIRERTKNEIGTVWFQGHWGFQYYSQLLGMRPFDFANSSLKLGDSLVIAKAALFTQAPPELPVASKELIEIKLRQPVMTMHKEMEAGFYASGFGVLPFAFGPAPTEQYDLFRVRATVQPDQWPPLSESQLKLGSPTP